MPKRGRYRKILRTVPFEDEEDFVPVEKEDRKALGAEITKNNYSDNILMKLEKFRTLHNFCDIILRIVKTNELFRAHTLILSASSLFFEELFQNPKHRDCRNLVLSLPEYIDSQGLEPVLKFIYSGTLNITVTSVISVFKVAWLFKMEDVLEMCREFCKRSNFSPQQVSVASEHVILQRDRNLNINLDVEQKDECKIEVKIEEKKEMRTNKKNTSSPNVNATNSSTSATTTTPSPKLITSSSVITTKTNSVESRVQPKIEQNMEVDKPPMKTNPQTKTTEKKNITTILPASVPQVCAVTTVTKVTPKIAPKLTTPILVNPAPTTLTQVAQNTKKPTLLISAPSSMASVVSSTTKPTLTISTPTTTTAILAPNPAKPSLVSPGSIFPNTLLFVQPPQTSPPQKLPTINENCAESASPKIVLNGNDIPVNFSTSSLGGKQENITIPKAVLDHINELFKNNKQTGKSSKVYFIKTQKPVENMKSLVTTIAASASKSISQPSFVSGMRMSLADKIKKITAANNECGETDKKEDIIEKTGCDLCTDTSENSQSIDGYRVQFFRPRHLSDKECNCKSHDLKRKGFFYGSTTSHCVAVLDVEPEVKYSHPILYLLHALKQKSDITDNYSLLTADVQHGVDHWRALVSSDDRFVTVERGEVHYLFPKKYQIKQEDDERFRQTVQELDEIEDFEISNDEKKEDKGEIKHEDSSNFDQAFKNSLILTNELKCEHCAYKFPSLAVKARHIYTTHVEKMFKDTDYYKYVCDQCDNFKHRSLTRVYFHKYREHGYRLSDYVKQFRCGLCCRIECSLVRIKEHYDRVHRDSRDYVCDKCGFAFKTASVLTSHIRCVHVKNFRWKCDHCNKQLKDKSTLGLHMRIHTGEKPFKCEDCEYASAFRGNLKTHMMKRHKKELQNLKAPDAYPRIYTRGRGRGRSRARRQRVKNKDNENESEV